MHLPFANMRLNNGKVYVMDKRLFTVGRQTANFDVDIDVGDSSFISRNHLDILWTKNALKLRCRGKNGIFVDKIFKPKGYTLHKLPKKCVLRFPSTSLCINIELTNSDTGTVRRNQPSRLLQRDRRLNKFHNNRLGIRRYRRGSRNQSSLFAPTTTREDDDHCVSSLSSWNNPSQSPSNASDNCGKSNDDDCCCIDELDPPSSSQNSTSTLTNDNQTSRARRKQLLRPIVSLSSSGFGSGSNNGGHVSKICSTETSTTSSSLIGSRPCINDPQQRLLPSSVLANALLTTPTTSLSSSDSAQQPIQSQARLCLFTQPMASDPSSAPLYHLTMAPSPSYSNRSESSKSKPPYSYAQLIAQAIASQPMRQSTLSGIYDFISRNYTFYAPDDKGWQNSVRHNLSLNRYFIKVPRSQNSHGKGCFWRIDPAFELKLFNSAYRKRRPRGAFSTSDTPSTSPLLQSSLPKLLLSPSSCSVPAPSQSVLVKPQQLQIGNRLSATATTSHSQNHQPIIYSTSTKPTMATPVRRLVLVKPITSSSSSSSSVIVSQQQPTRPIEPVIDHRSRHLLIDGEAPGNNVCTITYGPDRVLRYCPQTLVSTTTATDGKHKTTSTS